MALHGWQRGAFVAWASTPYGRQLIESDYIRIIMNDVAAMKVKDIEALVRKIKADDLEDKVINNLILNIRIKRPRLACKLQYV